MVKTKKFRVIYNSDPKLVTDNHKSEVIFLLDVDERNFDDIDGAVKFLGECTSPITSIEEFVPELKKIRKPKNLEWILPESHIRPKHVLMDNMEKTVINQQNHW